MSGRSSTMLYLNSSSAIIQTYTSVYFHPMKLAKESRDSPHDFSTHEATPNIVKLAGSAGLIGADRWRPGSTSRRPSSSGGRRRDHARDARGRSLGSTPLPTWSAHETG